MARCESASVACFRRRCRSLVTQLARVLVIHCNADPPFVVRWSGGCSRLASDYWTFDRTNCRRCAGGRNWSANFRHADISLDPVCSGLPSKSRPFFDTVVCPGSCFHSSDVLERPFPPPTCGMGGVCMRRRILRSRAAGASRCWSDRAFLEAQPLDAVAVAPRVGNKVTCRPRERDDHPGLKRGDSGYISSQRSYLQESR